MGPCRPQMGPMLAPWTLPSRSLSRITVTYPNGNIFRVTGPRGSSGDDKGRFSSKKGKVGEKDKDDAVYGKNSQLGYLYGVAPPAEI